MQKKKKKKKLSLFDNNHTEIFSYWSVIEMNEKTHIKRPSISRKFRLRPLLEIKKFIMLQKQKLIYTPITEN